MKRSTDETLIAALRVLARDIESQDGIANAAISEAADRLEELVRVIRDTIEENLDLADGEVCTLRALVIARDAGMWQRQINRVPEIDFMNTEHATTAVPVERLVRRSSFLTVSQQYDLNVVCRPLAQLFGYGVYHVGSSLERPDYRDVDLRCILANDEFDRMFLGDNNGKRMTFLNVAISEWIQARTGLPIDFQFQREAEANAEFPGRRNAVGCTAP